MSDKKIINKLNKKYGLFKYKYDSLENTRKSGYSTTEGLVNGLILNELDLTDIPSDVFELKSLKKLILYGNKINEISYQISALNNLEVLFISQNHFHKFPLSIISLRNLKYLNIGANYITELPRDICKLSSLVKLNLTNNLLSTLPKEIEKLINLRELNISFNKFKILPVKIGKLSKLCFLDIRYNDIKIFPNFLLSLKNLSVLRFEHNDLKALPYQISELETPILWKGNNNLNGFFFEENPLVSPPVEIVKQGNEAIRNYFQQIKKQGEDHIYEAKMLIVGEPGAGKTTLFNKLLKPGYLPRNASEDEKNSTVGINIKPGWCFPWIKNKQLLFKTNLWDFGGHPVQYIVHQYFLTARSLYVLLCDNRKQNTNFDYWLDVISLIGGTDSTVMVVLNEIQHQSVTNFDINEYQRLFPDLKIHQFPVDLDDDSDGRFDFLLKSIQHELSHLPHIGQPLPAKWIPIRQDMEQMRLNGINYISTEEYNAVCEKHKVSDKGYKEQILGYFHDLGIALHHSNDRNLSTIVILNPYWVVDALYAVLVDTKIEKNNGKFEEQWLFEFWEEKGYKHGDCNHLLNLMLKDKFEICYKLGNCGTQYLVPALLPSKKPEFDFDESDLLQLRFQYPFMPPGIISRLIVRLHHLIAHQNDHEVVWQKGVLFTRNGSFARVQEGISAKEGLKFIHISITGKHRERKGFLDIIKNEILYIHSNWFDDHLRYTELVPCNCGECKESKDPHYFELIGELQNRLNKNKYTIDCKISTEPVNILQLLGEVYDFGTYSPEIKDLADLINLLKSGKLDRQAVLNIINVTGSNNWIGQELRDNKINEEYSRSQDFFPENETAPVHKKPKGDLPLLEELSDKLQFLKMELISNAYDADKKYAIKKEIKELEAQIKKLKGKQKK